VSPEENTEESLTRKQRREQARTERKATEEAEASAAARRRRLMQLGGVLVAVVVIIVVIVVATGGKGSGKATTVPKTAAAKSEQTHVVTSLLNGVPQEGMVLGKPNAAATLVYFGDLECPICQEFTLEALPGLIANMVRSGKLRIEYKSLSTATGTAESDGAEPSGTFTSQQIGAYAAGKQNLAWYYIELFYHEQGAEDSGYVNEAFVQSIAQQVPGMNLTQWQADRGDNALETKVIEEEREASQIGFTGTPSFMLGKTGGTLKPIEPSSLKESSVFESEVNKVLAS
jgi:protein-disulfide isomerase